MFEYFEGIKNILNDVEVKETKSIKNTIDEFVNAINNKKSIFVFGASHAGIITQEMFYRAGGLMSINPIFDEGLEISVEPITKTSAMERLPGYGKIIADKVPFDKEDILLVHSVSGRNPVIIDLVIAAKQKGVKVICITNMKYSQSVTSRHHTGKNLYQFCDIIIDNHGDIGDGMISFDQINQKVGPTSTVIGATIVNTIIVETVRQLLKLGYKNPPIFYSANLDNGDEVNKKNIEKYLNTIHYKF